MIQKDSVIIKPYIICVNNDQLNELIKEIEDKFGRMPRKALELIFAVKIRIAALDTGFQRIIVRDNILIAEFPPSENKMYYQNAFPIVAEYLQEFPDTKIYHNKNKLMLETSLLNRKQSIEILWRIKKTLDTIEY